MPTPELGREPHRVPVGTIGGRRRRRGPGAAGFRGRRAPRSRARDRRRGARKRPRAVGVARGARRAGSGSSCAPDTISTALAAGRGGCVESLLERPVGVQRQEEPDLHAAQHLRDADGPALLGRAGEREDHGEAAQVVGGRALRLLAGGERPTQLREHAEPVDCPQRGQRAPAARARGAGRTAPCRAGRRRRRPTTSPVRGSRGAPSRRSTTSATSGSAHVPSYATGVPSSSVSSATTVGIVLERRVRHPPAARVDLDDLRAGDHAEHVDVVDRHVEEIRVGHPATPVAAGDPRVAQVAPAGDADAEQRAELAGPNEVAKRARLPPEAVVLRHHRVPAARSAAAAIAAASAIVSASGFSTIT